MSVAHGSRNSLNLARVLFLDMTLRVVKANVHSLAVGTDRPSRDLNYMANIDVRFDDRSTVYLFHGDIRKL